MANVVHNLKVNGSTYPVGTVHYIAGTGTTAGTWLGTDNSITEYFDGLTIAYKIPIAGASTTTLNINNLGAKTVRRNTNNLTTHLPVNTVVILTYTTISGTGYWVWADYNSDTDTKVTQIAPEASGYTNWRPLVIGSSNNSTEGFTPSTTTDGTYTFKTITAQPSSGTIRATTFKGDLSGNANTATKLATARTISLSGDASGSITFDGSEDKTLTVTVADDSHNHVISNVDGLQTALDGKAPTSHASSATTYGVSSSSNYGHAMASSTTPKANGTAAVGSETAKFARGDHVHPLQTTVSGNAGTATKLATARSIALGTGATGTATNFDGSANITIPVTSVKEAYLSWGGKNFSGSYGCIDAAMIPELGANRLAFMPSAGVVIEYSRNGGSTWIDYGASADTKINLFNGIGTGIRIGADSTKGIDKSSYMVRVTINTSAAKVYTELNKFVIYCSTEGSTGSYCTIQARLQSNYESGTETWKTLADKVGIAGWSGYNVINISPTTTYGNSKSNQYGQIRFTFGVTSHSSSVAYAGLSIIKIYGFGGAGWTTPSTMAKTGRMYTYDSGKNVAFPATVTATGFSGPLTGNATTASGIKDSANSSTITASYASAQLAYSDITHLACWNGYQLRAVNKSVFAASDHTHSVATTSAPGFMSKDDKSKLDGITASADSVSFSASAASGNKVGTITINGTATDMYSPTQTTVSGNAGSATKLATARTIDGMSFNGTASIAHYGTCSTAAATAAKVVSLTGFTLDTGARIVVKFTVTNTASSPTLNVNSTGAKAIYYRGSAITASYLAANRTYEFVYNGTQWDLVGDINTDSAFRVLQTATTSNASYPLLLAPSGQTSTVSTTSYFDSGVTLNPSTNTIAANVSGSAGSVAWENVSSKPSYYDAKAIKSITRSGATFTYTCLDDTTGTFTQQDNNTAHSHSVGTGLTVSGSGGTSGTTTYSANLNSTTSLGTIGTTSKLYAVGVDANGKLCVNVPWTDTNTVYTHPSYTAHSSGLYKITVDSKGHVSEATAVTKADITNLGIPSTNTTYSTAKYNTSGLVKPAYTSTGAATLTTAAASNTTTPTIAAKTTTSGRYYAVEADKNGVLFVNVPWTYTDTKVTNNTTTSKYYLTGSTSNSNTTGTLVKRSTVYVDTSGNLVANNIPSTGLTWQSF